MVFLLGSLIHVVGPGPGASLLLPVGLGQLLLLAAVEPTVLEKFCPFISFFNLAQSYLQVLGLDPVDVMAVGALPHHLTSNGTAPSHTIDQTYERTDEGDGAAEDDEEGLDADVVLQ